jgi:hypothetical protein
MHAAPSQQQQCLRLLFRAHDHRTTIAQRNIQEPRINMI